MQTTNKKKTRIPTEEEFLKYKPYRADYKWSTNSNDLVEIKVPKFTGQFGISFCNIIKKENIFTAKMDKLGSIVWKN